MPKIMHIVGARPNFVKIASIIKACRAREGLSNMLIHTGQHYSPKMSAAFFDELAIPEPDLNLEVGSDTHARQTAEIMKRFEPVLLKEQPDAILVVGDVNSTVACVLTAAKLGIKTIHVEAGLRSFDRSMPEEINRILTDSISDFLFVTEQSGLDNLKTEGIDDTRVHFVGNVMIDTLLQNREKAEKSKILSEYSIEGTEYAVATLHRPSNVDDPAVLARILDAMEVIQRDMKIVFPIHPRTLKNIRTNALEDRVSGMHNLMLIEPLGYLDFLKLTSDAALVMSDSGGIQEETTILGVPCLTIRESTERPATVEIGTNQVVGTRTAEIIAAYRKIREGNVRGDIPPLWDGGAAERIAAILLEEL